MASFNGKLFTQNYSQRTLSNLQFITNIVRSEENNNKFKLDFMKRYEEIIDSIEELEMELGQDAINIKNSGRNGQVEYRKINSLKDKIASRRECLQRDFRNLFPHKIIGDKLYEVTQSLNSLLGIAVLPYEMNKEKLDPYNPDEDLLLKLQGTSTYDDIFGFIEDLKKHKKYKSSYPVDKDNNKIVLSFLRHIRNSVCHSGDEALTILPLDGGEIIEEILFYDKYVDDNKIKSEFAMKITVPELEKLIELISDFYKLSFIGAEDKSKDIKEAERKVNCFLNS